MDVFSRKVLWRAIFGVKLFCMALFGEAQCMFLAWKFCDWWFLAGKFSDWTFLARCLCLTIGKMDVFDRKFLWMDIFGVNISWLWICGVKIDWNISKFCSKTHKTRSRAPWIKSRVYPLAMMRSRMFGGKASLSKEQKLQPHPLLQHSKQFFGWLFYCK